MESALDYFMDSNFSDLICTLKPDIMEHTSSQRIVLTRQRVIAAFEDSITIPSSRTLESFG